MKKDYINNIIKDKNYIILKIQEIKKQKNSRINRSLIKDYSNIAANYENIIARYYIDKGQYNNAVINLISRASLLVEAKQYKKASNVYKFSLRYIQDKKMEEYILGNILSINKIFEIKNAIKDKTNANNG